MADDFRPVTPAMIRALARSDFDRGHSRELPPQSSAAFDYREEYDRLAQQAKYPASQARRVELAQEGV